MRFPEPPVNEILAALLLLAGAFLAVRGTRRLADGLAQAIPLHVIRGIRAWCIALAMVALAAGMLTAETGFVVLGAVFLAEELYETGLVAGIIRGGEGGPRRRD
jgi:hypothetical protein